ncbi:MAG: Uma2 family endonuclease [Vicinamibacterales bacterium]
MSEHSPDALRLSPKRYFELAECGIIAPDDRVELLEGLIVSMTAQSAPHAATVYRVEHALLRKLGPDTIVRVQMTFLAGDRSVPEPDLAVVPASPDDYFEFHPSHAHLIVEVAHSSVLQDRITKAAIYARAGIPCYWIVNVRDRCVEIFREPDRERARYAATDRIAGSKTITIDAFPDVMFSADELLPPQRSGESVG